MMEELTTQMRSKRENFQLKSGMITTTEVTALPPSFDWKLKIEFLTHFYSRNYEDKIGKWQGVPTL
jgi:hypothetical protein